MRLRHTKFLTHTEEVCLFRRRPDRAFNSSRNGLALSWFVYSGVEALVCYERLRRDIDTLLQTFQHVPVVSQLLLSV